MSHRALVDSCPYPSKSMVPETGGLEHDPQGRFGGGWTAADHDLLMFHDPWLTIG